MTSRRGLGLLVAAALGSFGPPAGAGPLLLADPDVAHLVRALQASGKARTDWLTQSRSDIFTIGCAPGQSGLMVISVDPPTRRELARCADASVAIVAPIGREAVYLVAKEPNGTGFTSRALYRALAAAPSEGVRFAPNTSRRWRDVDPRLPKAVLHILLPSIDAPPRALFARAILEAGCRDLPAVAAILLAPEAHTSLHRGAH